MLSDNELFPALPPKIIELEQRTPEWHAWRRGEDIDGPRITGSMMPQIIGVSPYGNAYDLWLELTGRKPPQVSNFAMQRGINLEPIAREAYTRKTGIEVRDICVEHPIVPWIAASLDGYSLFGDVIAEIKCPGKNDHATALLNQVPEKYVPQVQWQLLNCPNAEREHYWSYDGSDGVLVERFPDRDYQRFLATVALHFREAVINDVPPDGMEFANLALQIRQLYQEKKRIEEAYKAATADLQKLLPDHAKSASFAGVSVSRSQPDGRIDYEQLVKDQNIDAKVIELYRKKAKDGDTFRVTVNLNAVIPELGLPAPESVQVEPDQAVAATSW